jgi:hypothetical protein
MAGGGKRKVGRDLSVKALMYGAFVGRFHSFWGEVFWGVGVETQISSGNDEQDMTEMKVLSVFEPGNSGAP